MERPNAPSRSDCHAWSASPNVELFPYGPGRGFGCAGFRRVVVAPHLRKRARRRHLDFGPGVTGELIWKGQRHELTAGLNRITAL